MARKPQTLEEVDAIKQKIMQHALQIIVKHGYDGFTMKALAKSLGTAAPGIYYYFGSKEEIFLNARKHGFLMLYERQKRTYDSHTDSFCALQAFTKNYIDFALENPSYYKIMIQMDVPLYPDFKETLLQDMASQVVNASMPLADLCIQVMEELAETYQSFPKKEARVQFMLWFSGIHGIVSLYNNNTFNMLHESPIDVIYKMAEHFLAFFK